MPDKTEIEAIAKRKKGRAPALWTGLAVLALAAAGVWYWQAGNSDAKGTTYTTAPAATADIRVTVTATGTIEPVNTVDISSELSGTIRAVNADFNDMVKAGDILAELDTDKLEANVARVSAALTARRASLVEAEVTLDEKREAYERAVQLADKGISTQESLLTAKAAYQRAEAALETAKANIQVAEADLKLEKTILEKACICSPIDGIVLDRSVEVGQIVASSLSAPTLFTLADDLSRMELTVAIDEADIGQVLIGNDAVFTVEAYQDMTFQAAITELRFAPETVDGVVTYKAILDVDNNELLLRPGMTATAEITVAEHDGVLAVPNAALRFAPPVQAAPEESGSGLLGMLIPSRPAEQNAAANRPDAEGMRSIWVLRDNAPEEVKVRTGPSDGSVTQVVEGELKQGDPVITDMSTGQ
jgi:HlyD family secretion protein